MGLPISTPPPLARMPLADGAIVREPAVAVALAARGVGLKLEAIVSVIVGPYHRAVGWPRDHSSMDALVGECVAVAGTPAGAVVGVAGGCEDPSKGAPRSPQRDAFGVYLGALYPAVVDLRELPDVDGLPMLDQAVNRLCGEKTTFIASRRRERQIFGDGMRDRAHGVGIAVAGLQVLPLPPPVRDAVDVANDYLERLGERRTHDLKSEWTEVHEKLMAAAELLRSQ